LLFYHNIL